MTTVPLPAFEPGHPLEGIFRRLNLWLDLRLVPTRKSTASDISLAYGGIHALTSFRGGRIECTEGSVWLTHDGDCRDVVLEAGQSHMADRDSRLVIYALSSSAVRLVSPHHSRRRAASVGARVAPTLGVIQPAVCPQIGKRNGSAI